MGEGRLEQRAETRPLCERRASPLRPGASPSSSAGRRRRAEAKPAAPGSQATPRENALAGTALCIRRRNCSFARGRAERALVLGVRRRLQQALGRWGAEACAPPRAVGCGVQGAARSPARASRTASALPSPGPPRGSQAACPGLGGGRARPPRCPKPCLVPRPAPRHPWTPTWLSPEPQSACARQPQPIPAALSGQADLSPRPCPQA